MAPTKKQKALADELPAALKKGATLDPLALVAAATIEAIDATGKKQMTALHYACDKARSDVVAALIARGAALSLPGKHGDTPLHIAALKRDIDSVRLLLDAGADARALSDHGESALHSAAFGGSRECVEAIMAHPDAPDLHGLGTYGRSVVSLVCYGLYGGGEDAAIDLLRWLVERGASVDVFNASGFSPVHFACGARMRRLALCVAGQARAVDASGLLAAVTVGYLDVGERLVEHTGGTAAYAGAAAEAFRTAALIGKVPVCEWVLVRWPEVAVRDAAVSEPGLRRAIRWGNVAMVDYLLDLGVPAELPLVAPETHTLLEQAMGHKEWDIVARLIARGASTKARWQKEYLADAPAAIQSLFQT